ncbi:MAG: hypothetical protein PHZ06_08920 [Proteiniphilum sp.]|nr:hypothetical protein [Proteiniphilum sp.]
MDILKIFICTFLGVVCTYLATCLDKKRQALEADLKSQKNSEILDYGSKVWDMVEEYFRVHPDKLKDISTTLEKFSEVLKSKFPELTEDEIRNIRGLIAGLKNSGKAKIK